MPLSFKIWSKTGRIPKFRLASRGLPENFLWEIFLQLLATLILGRFCRTNFLALASWWILVSTLGLSLLAPCGVATFEAATFEDELFDADSD